MHTVLTPGLLHPDCYIPLHHFANFRKNTPKTLLNRKYSRTVTRSTVYNPSRMYGVYGWLSGQDSFQILCLLINIFYCDFYLIHYTLGYWSRFYPQNWKGLKFFLTFSTWKFSLLYLDIILFSVLLKLSGKSSSIDVEHMSSKAPIFNGESVISQPFFIQLVTFSTSSPFSSSPVDFSIRYDWVPNIVTVSL